MLNEQIGVANQVTNMPPPVQPASPAGGPAPVPPTPPPSSFFKLVVIMAILSVVVLVVSFGYYLYTVSQIQTNKITSSSNAAPTPLPQPGQATISASDKTQVLETELNQTKVEDFEADFQALQEDAAGL